MLPESIWSALTEVSLLFHILCSTILDVNKVQELEASVATILCNLEKIFPTSFFYSIEHLIAHFSYKAHVQGPVQYRWMYSFESLAIDMYVNGSFLNELYEKYHPENPIIEELVAIQFKDWFKRHETFQKLMKDHQSQQTADDHHTTIESEASVAMTEQ
ncbi:UNVERIFIED_CONTAM: hypothetical protein Scaly_0070300 [Sesamum calycinum]|uniref:DUF4218 domain-containing protein n=1 Tax=Sesamum calycinum TaxID=2727403 RepID=A0AAW2SUL0_9LAMI